MMRMHKDLCSRSGTTQTISSGSGRFLAEEKVYGHKFSSVDLDGTCDQGFAVVSMLYGVPRTVFSTLTSKTNE